MRQFNVGVLGIGDISDVYFNNLKEYGIVNVIACAGRDMGKAQRKADQHNIPKAYATSKELIEDPEIDIILNLTVPSVHAELNIEALKAGKHVYSEKPLATTLTEAEEVMNLAQEKGLYVGCAPDTFLGGRLQTCRKVIEEGKIGEIVGASAFVVSHGQESFHPNPAFFYKAGGGPLLDIGPYYITALLSLLGPVKSCSAMARKTFDKRTIYSQPRKGEQIEVEVDTHITGNLEFGNGAIVTLITSFDVWDSELPRIEIYGTKGTLCIDDVDPLEGPNLFGGPLFLKTEETHRWKNQPRQYPLSDWEKVPVVHPFTETSHEKNSRGIGLVEMAYAIIEKREERASGKMAFHSLEVMEGLLASAKEKRFIQMESTFNQPVALPINFLTEEVEVMEDLTGKTESNNLE